MNSTIQRLSLNARDRVAQLQADRHHSLDLMVAQRNSRPVSQRDEGREEMRRQVRESLQALDTWEDGVRYPPRPRVRIGMSNPLRRR